MLVFIRRCSGDAAPTTNNHNSPTMALRYLIEKEFLQIRRNAFLPKLVVMFPIMIMCVMPWVASMEVKNLVVDVVDNDHSSMSSRLIHELEASRYFIFGAQRQSYDEALTDIENSRADVILEIPPRFESDLINGRRPQMLIASNAVSGTKGSMAGSYLSSIVTTAVTGTSGSDMLKVLYLYNKNLNYKVFMIPSLMAIVMLLMCGFLPTLNIVGEKESGTIEAINVTPVKKWEFILAKMIPYWIIAMVVMTICFVLSWAVYGITSEGSLLLVYLISILMALIFSGLGLIISNYNDTMQQAVFVMWFVVVNIILLSGLFTPVRSMPDWAYMTTWINPMHYYIDAVRTVFVRGGTFMSIAHQVFALAAFALAVNLWAVKSYSKYDR